MKLLFGDKGIMRENIILVDNEKVISEDVEVAQTFGNFFEKIVDTLGIVENKLLLSTGNNKSGVENAIEMFQAHPSIISIKKNVQLECEFSFSIVNAEDIRKEVKNLSPKKTGPFRDIPVKPSRQVCEVVCEPLAKIWNEEVIKINKFPAKLKLADITPIFKSIQKTLVKNYRPISVLPIVSKIFERIMDKQTDSYIDKILSPYLCGYRKGYSCQHALLAMIEKWKKSLDEGGMLEESSWISQRLLIQ